MKLFIALLCLVFCGAFTAAGYGAPWQPAAGYQQIPIWPKMPSGHESFDTVTDSPVAGKPWVEVKNVSRPTMTVYAPKGNNTGAAVVVFPGGGYKILAIDLEGTEVCNWLTSKGVTCVLLKYRVPDSGPHWDKSCDCQTVPKVPMALQDAQRTLGLVRLHAKEWHIDPHKIGVLGFSAGGFLVADISNHFDKRAYAPVDAADRESCRPDFAVALYPGHLWWDKKNLVLNPAIKPTRNTPPTFLLQAENDHVDNVNQVLTYYIALKDAGVPVEMHLYAEGNHAFGLRRTKFPITAWPELVEKWLGTIGMVNYPPNTL